MKGKILAGTLLFIWLGTITAGRLMAYHGIANVERQASVAVIVVAGLILLGYAAAGLVGWTKPSQVGV